jgi:tRNA (adenine37-N6)-methyltransferase
MPQAQSHTTTTTVLAATALTAITASVTLSIGYYFHRQKLHALEQRAEHRRLEERRGRIRAEVQLRTVGKQKESLELHLNTKAGTEDDHKMVLQCIGTIVSPFTKRMGTPRQGSLVPSSRAFIQLTIPMESLDGMDQYSHLWILFKFHANTNNPFNNQKNPKTKVRPPRANQKVGQLATRSPHRPNPLGLSLVQMERLDLPNKRLYISALDLVHGTPVYDVKPCVPWDIPGYHESLDKTVYHALRVPEWVAQDDVLDIVEWSPQAESALAQLLTEGRLEPLYKASDLEAARATLTEMLAQDPRASHKGLKVNQRGTATAAADPLYTLVFGQTQVEFLVRHDRVRVEQIVPIDFRDDAYVEGIPVILIQKEQT